MATKKAAPKKTATKAKSKSTVVKKIKIELTEKQRAKAQECIAKNGKVTFRIKEISFTKIPKTITSEVVTD